MLDADIAKCFDRIDHEALLRKLNTFPLLRRQIRAWLRAGVMDGQQLFPTSRSQRTGMILAQTVLATFKDASEKLTGHRKRDFIASVTEDYFDGSARKAETVMGWNRHSVQLGLNERRTGLICILNTHSEQLSTYMGHSAETSDFIVDCLTAWWKENKPDYPEISEWVIDLDGGAATRSDHTQFIKRMVELNSLPLSDRSFE